MYEQAAVGREVFGNGENMLICGNVMKLPEEIRRLAGKVQCVYLDPPFMTGERFRRKRPYGEKGWKTGAPALTLPAFEDHYTDERAYLRLLKRMINASRELLRDTGVFYLHLDWRMASQARALCDKAFGKSRFLNEIVWAYESGGRARKYFPRKHDVILFYAKGARYTFDLTKVPLSRKGNRRNHMARGVDEENRSFSRIVSNGKEYRYYDDEPVYPGDVWTDIGFLQQRDPERTGYATQKPLALLERLLLPVTEPGDLVADLCCGSGTTLEAAQNLGCRFAGLDISPETVSVALSRLKPENLTVDCPCCRDKAVLKTDYDGGRLEIGGLEIPDFPGKGRIADNLEGWDTGRIENGVFLADGCRRRSYRYPELVLSLKMKEEDLPEAIMTTDAAGNRRVFARVK